MNQLPPHPPSDTQPTLGRLRQYYQELIAYHSVALEDAKRMLSHTEVLLGTLHESNLGGEPQSLWQENLLPRRHENGDNAQLQLESESYSRLTQAIKKILEESRGEVVHMDYFVRELYGSHLDSELEKLARAKVEAALEQGKQRGDWDAYPDSPGCYTIDLALFPGLAAKDSSGIHPPSLPPEVTIKPKYCRESFGKTVEAVLKATRKPMTVREVARELFEDFSPELWEPARRVTGSALIKAYERNAIQRVSKGEYRCL